MNTSPSSLEAANAALIEKRRALGLKESVEQEFPLLTFNFPVQTPEEIAAMEAQEAAEALEKEREAERARIAETERLFANSGVPGRHANAEIDAAPEWAKTWDSLRDSIGKGTIRVLLGTRGSGKTQLAVEAVRYCTEQGWRARYTKAIEIFLDIREAMRMPEGSEKKAIRGFVGPRLLVIDAMEVRGETDFENRILDYVIDMRYDEGKDTILISNQTKEKFAESIGPSIISRIHETGGVTECKWQSFREAKRTYSGKETPPELTEMQKSNLRALRDME